MELFKKIKNKIIKNNRQESKQEITIEEFKALGTEGLKNCTKYSIKGNHIHATIELDEEEEIINSINIINELKNNENVKAYLDNYKKIEKYINIFQKEEYYKSSSLYDYYILNPCKSVVLRSNGNYQLIHYGYNYLGKQKGTNKVMLYSTLNHSKTYEEIVNSIEQSIKFDEEFI